MHFEMNTQLSCTYKLLHELSLLASIVLLLSATAVQKYFVQSLSQAKQIRPLVLCLDSCLPDDNLGTLLPSTA